MATDATIALVTLADAHAYIGKVITEGSDLAPALEAAGWTCADGWSAGSGTLAKVAGAGTGTATPSGTFTIVAGTRYKVTITCTAVSGTLSYTLGGAAGSNLAVGTFSDYITALTTGKIIFSGGAAVTGTIIALTVKAISGETEDDSIIEYLIDGVSAAFNSYVGRQILEKTDTTLYLDGNGRALLQLPRWPVTSITSVTEDDAALTEGDDNDYVLYSDEGILRRIGTVWFKWPKSVLLASLKAGYPIASLPKDLKFAALKQIAAEFKDFRMRSQGEMSRTAPDGSTTKRELEQFLPEVKAVLDRYRGVSL